MLLTDEPAEDCNILARLGPGFWLPWALTIAAVVGGYAAFLIWLRPLLAPPLDAVAGGGGAILFTLALIALAWAPRRVLNRRGLVDDLRPAGRRYTRRFVPAMMAYVVVLICATWTRGHLHPAGVTAVLVGLAPSLPILLAIRAMVLFTKEETDEFLRARMLEGWSLATGLALAVCTVWGFLDQFGVVAHVPLWAVFPVWATCLGPAHWLMRRP
jgi:hypothetical protein